MSFVRKLPGMTDTVFELGISFLVGCGAAGYTTYLLRQSIQSKKKDIISTISPLPDEAKISFEELYSPVPRVRPNSFYAAFASSWNSALSALRKTISDIFSP
mmetsp:Transcript_3426/g.4801  ORF Transcript_3426/g.4801 Transcript_3426/m.4801 type:complete len:102 (+) Transcript_3426:74-379(+)